MGFDVVLPKPFSIDRLGRALVEGQQRRGGATRVQRLSAEVSGSPHHATNPAKRILDATAATAVAAAAAQTDRIGRPPSLSFAVPPGLPGAEIGLSGAGFMSSPTHHGDLQALELQGIPRQPLSSQSSAVVFPVTEYALSH